MNSPFRRGDFFTSISPGLLGDSIAFVQKMRTIGLLSSFTHSGFFIDENTVFESLWKVQRTNVWDAYEGKIFLAGRWSGMTDARFERAYKYIKQFEGKWYPAPRLLMFLFTPIMVQLVSPMKYIGLGFFSPLICSEMAGCFGKQAGFTAVFGEFMGMTPARVAYVIGRDKDIEEIHPEALLRRPL